jgi:hypothetical protein
MWGAATRAGMVAVEKKTKRYPSDLTDDEWIALEFSLRQPRGGARNPTTDFREIVVLRTVRGRGYHSIAGEADWVTFETISQRPSRQDHTN